MHVFVNGERVRVTADRLADILQALGYDRAKVVVAVNETFVPREQWPETSVNTGDRLDVLSAMQGG